VTTVVLMTLFFLSKLRALQISDPKGTNFRLGLGRLWIRRRCQFPSLVKFLRRAGASGSLPPRGGSMTTISLGQAARPSGLGTRAIAASIKGGRLPTDGGRYFVGSVQLRQQFEMSNVTSRPQEFAGGFVDFLLGRGTRHSR
jgi:hypothetical protein